MNISNTKIIKNIFSDLLNLRRSIHQYPELAWQEFETSKKVEMFLRKYGFSTFAYPLETGFICDLVGKQNNKYIAIRADLDALPLLDEKKVSYASKNEGVCHACGHDVHTAVVCGVAAVLKTVEETLPVNVRFIFQPAEEPIPTGAPKMIEKGVLDGIHSILGIHVEPNLPVNSVGLTAGWVNAQSIRLKWELKGQGGHSARPHQTKDPILAGVQLIQQVYQMAYRRWNRFEFPVIVSFTKFESGTTYNAIPDAAKIEGTLRLTVDKTRDLILDQLVKLHKNIEITTGVKIQFEIFYGAPPVVNDTDIISKLIAFSRASTPDRNVITDFRSMGGDDFGYYSSLLPAAMVRFGVGKGEKTPGLHTGFFDVPEEIIENAVSFFVDQILNWKLD